MNLLSALRVFVAVAEESGMAPAARRLSMSTSTLSRHLRDLEDWSGSQLFTRTTRSLSLTATGETQLERARSILAMTSEFQDGGGLDQTGPLKGKLRITAPEFVFQRIVKNALVSFATQHKGLQLELMSTDRQVDLVREGFDIGLRIGKLDDSSMRSRKLLSIPTVLVTSPDYLESHSTPVVVSDLKQHICILDSAPGYFDFWPIKDESAPRGVKVSGQIQVTSGEAAAEFARMGQGIAFLPETFIQQDLQSGRLIQLLADANKPHSDLHFLYPAMQFASKKVSAFLRECTKQLAAAQTAGNRG